MASILVVDDEPDIRELVRINLELDGHSVITASNGSEALDFAVGEHPDLVVLDVMMPGMDGWEVLASMKAAPDPLVAEIPVVMLTARDDQLDRIRSGIEGALRYLTKPFSPGELRAEVALTLEGGAEPVRRRQVQQDAMVELARFEGGKSDEPADDVARPHITRLERPVLPPRPPQVPAPLPAARLESLSEKQRELLDAVATTPTVTEAAGRLDVSRSNVYASLRRICVKLECRSVPELIAMVRGGRLGT